MEDGRWFFIRERKLGENAHDSLNKYLVLVYAERAGASNFQKKLLALLPLRPSLLLAA
jgi:hypothetical protein